MSVSVCLSVCLYVCLCVCLSVRDHIFGTTRPVLTTFFVHVNNGRGSVPFSWRSDTLLTYFLFVLPVLWMTSYLHIS